MTKSSADTQQKKQQPADSSTAGHHAAPVWPIDQEMNLFVALRGHKPVGVDRHFQMLYISEKLNAAQRERGLQPVPIRDIWALMDGLYSMPALHDSEVLPFANKEAEFSLPVEAPDWKPVVALEFPRVAMATSHHRAAASSAAAAAASAGGSGAGGERKRGRPPRSLGAAAAGGGTASPLATPSSRSQSPAPSSSDAGDSTATGSASAKKAKR